jgi:hypothetical protein
MKRTFFLAAAGLALVFTTSSAWAISMTVCEKYTVEFVANNKKMEYRMTTCPGKKVYLHRISDNEIVIQGKIIISVYSDNTCMVDILFKWPFIRDKVGRPFFFCKPGKGRNLVIYTGGLHDKKCDTIKGEIKFVGIGQWKTPCN